MRRGFTLVEIMVVLLILGVMAGTAAPAFINHSGDEGTAPAQHVAELLRHARRTALRRGETVTLHLDCSTGRYAIRATASGRTLFDEKLDLPIGARMHAEDAPARFRFHATGTASGPAIRVHSGGRSHRVTVDRWTGNVLLDSQ